MSNALKLSNLSIRPAKKEGYVSIRYYYIDSSIQFHVPGDENIDLDTLLETIREEEEVSICVHYKITDQDLKNYNSNSVIRGKHGEFFYRIWEQMSGEELYNDMVESIYQDSAA